jgi:hypothetical protein
VDVIPATANHVELHLEEIIEVKKFEHRYHVERDKLTTLQREVKYDQVIVFKEVEESHRCQRAFFGCLARDAAAAE